MDLRLLRDNLGHASLTTTSQYLCVDHDRRHQEAEEPHGIAVVTQDPGGCATNKRGRPFHSTQTGGKGHSRLMSKTPIVGLTCSPGRKRIFRSGRR